MTFGLINDTVQNEDIPEVDLTEQRVSEMLGDIKRNSRNRRIAMFAPVVLAAAVLGAMIAAPPRHGGLALVADAETPDPQLPRVFGSNGVWRLAKPIEEAPATDPGPADMIQAPTGPTAPSFMLLPPDQEDLNSLSTSMSTPPMSTSRQSPDTAAAGSVYEWVDPADSDRSAFSAVIRIELNDVASTTRNAAESDDPATKVLTPVEIAITPDIPSNGPDDSVSDNADTDESDMPDDGDVTVAVEEPRTEPQDPTEANPSTPTDDPVDTEVLPATLPATIIPQLVLVYSAHVSVTVQVVDDDSSVIDWCNTRVDWGDGSISRVAGVDDADLCTASCEYESISSAASEIDADAFEAINENIMFEHDYTQTIDATPRIFVATGDGCSYSLAELELRQFTVVPLP
ncbi:MAG: hypothetical protein ACI88C_001207 [Acidimicrobiales bacterium]|jgi:hypothetical protein